MFIVENNKIKNEKSFLAENVFSPVRMDFEFPASGNLEGSRFSLELNGIECKKYMTDENTVSFRYIFLDFIESKTETVSVKLTKDSETILEDEIEITLNEFQEKQEEMQGVICDALPIKNSTKIILNQPELTSKITDFSHAFNSYNKLIQVSKFDTSKGTNFTQMFSYCNELTSIPELDTSNGTNFNGMFSYCYKLISIPELDTSKGTNFYGMFNYCYKLYSVPELDVSNGTNFDWIFGDCKELTVFGGLKNVKLSFSLNKSTKLTKDSLLNVLNKLADLTGSEQQKLTLGSTNLEKLTDQEKAIATNKNWILA